MNATRRPLKPDDTSPRRIADGAAEAIRQQVPPNGDGLGPLGERVVQSLLDDSEREEESQRLFMRFSPRWRVFIRRQDDDRLDAADDLIDDHIERTVMRKVWKRVWASLVVIVPACFAAAQYGLDRIPLLRSLINLFRGT